MDFKEDRIKLKIGVVPITDQQPIMIELEKTISRTIE
jgi:hypothetical protein